MNQEIMQHLNLLLERYPLLLTCKEDILLTYEILTETFKNKGKLLLAGNGGSCADCEHIAGELMKSFKKERKISLDLFDKLKEQDLEKGIELYNVLQEGLPCIVLTNHQGLNTAFINDVSNGGLYTYAQQVNVYGNFGDTLFVISTSGNAKNIYYACLVAKAKGMKIIGLSGETGGKLNAIADVCIKVPLQETYIIQEFHLPIYHCLCLMLENTFFKG